MIAPRTFEQATTNGCHALEVGVWAEFDATIERLAEYFSVLREVSGWYIQARAHCQPKQPRIDRVLCPLPKLRDAGWDLGPVGVECKRSDSKLGPVISQAIDYQRAVFPVNASYTVNLEWVFIWPTGPVAGDIGSIMAQQRIGSMQPLGNGIGFMCGDGFENRISVEHGVRYRRPRCGYKSGSR